MRHEENDELSNPFPVSAFEVSGWSRMLLLGSEEDAVSRVLDYGFRAALRLRSVFV